LKCVPWAGIAFTPPTTLVATLGEDLTQVVLQFVKSLKHLRLVSLPEQLRNPNLNSQSFFVIIDAPKSMLWKCLIEIETHFGSRTEIIRGYEKHEFEHKHIMYLPPFICIVCMYVLYVCMYVWPFTVYIYMCSWLDA